MLNTPLYFRESTLNIPYKKYGYTQHAYFTEEIKLLLNRLKKIKKSRVRSLKNMCAHAITKLGIVIDREKIPSELLEYVGNHRVKHRKLFPTLIHNKHHFDNWSIGKLFDYDSNYYRYYIIRDCEQSDRTYCYALTKDLVERLKMYNTKFQCSPSKYNLHLRLCPHIDLPILNSF